MRKEKKVRARDKGYKILESLKQSVKWLFVWAKISYAMPTLRMQNLCVVLPIGL